MKTLTAAAFLALGLAASGMAAEFKGFVEDESCSTKPGMKGDAECAAKCIKGGDKAFLVMADGKIYKLAEQAKITGHAGHNVTITGTLKGDTISIENVKM